MVVQATTTMGDALKHKHRRLKFSYSLANSCICTSYLVCFPKSTFLKNINKKYAVKYLCVTGVTSTINCSKSKMLRF